MSGGRPLWTHLVPEVNEAYREAERLEAEARVAAGRRALAAQVREQLARRRQATNDVAGDPATAFAEKKIPELAALYAEQTRPSKRRTAELAGIHRSTLDAWIARGWMTWPPKSGRESST